MRVRRKNNDDQEPIREFYLVARVRFRDFPAEDGGRNYFDDGDLRDCVEQWTSSAVDDREDGPSVTFRSLPEILVVDVDSVFRGDYPNHTDGDET